MTEVDSAQQTISEISSMYKNDNNKVHHGEMEPENCAEKSTPKGGLLTLILKDGWFEDRKSVV